MTIPLKWTASPAPELSQVVWSREIPSALELKQETMDVLTAEMLSPGQHINAVGGDCPGKTELHPDVLQQARVFCEYEPQTRIEGDIQQLAPDFPVTELWRVLTGSQAGPS